MPYMVMNRGNIPTMGDPVFGSEFQYTSTVLCTLFSWSSLLHCIIRWLATSSIWLLLLDYLWYRNSQVSPSFGTLVVELRIKALDFL
jgi:hypothetical protein